jgi:hypothetical protein
MVSKTDKKFELSLSRAGPSIGAPSSAWRKMNAIWLSLNFDLGMVNPARSNLQKGLDGYTNYLSSKVLPTAILAAPSWPTAAGRS